MAFGQLRVEAGSCRVAPMNTDELSNYYGDFLMAATTAWTVSF